MGHRWKRLKRVSVTNTGDQYTAPPAVTVDPPAAPKQEAKATATLSGGTVVKVEMDNESAGFGSGYDYASVLFSGGSPSKPAKARAVIGPKNGIGSDVRDDLKASSIMLNIKPDGTVTNTFIVGNDFRQISLLKSPKLSDSSVAGGFFKGTSSRVMRSMKANTTTAAATLTIGREITDGSTPKIRAYIDDISDSSIFYHQNDSSGFGVFANSASISDGINGITIDSGDIKPPVDPYSGELLYLENRARILRDAAQQEDIKVILNSGTLDKKSKLRSNFEKHKDLVCVPFYDDDKNILLNFANDFFQKKKLSVSREILNLLVERCRGDRFNLKNELIKIESYTKSRKQISGEEILNLTNLSENYSFSELADACLSKNKRKTVNIINENNFSSEDCIAIIRVFMNKAKRILSLMKMNEKNNNIEKNISMFKPPIFWKDKDVVREQVKHWSVQTIENFIFSINDTELLIKKNNNISVNLLNDFILSQFEANN